MKVVCPACNARYRLPDDRVRGKVLKIRCKSCGHIFQVRDPNTKATDSASIRSRSTRATGAFGAVDDTRKSDSTSAQSLQTSTGSFSDERIWYYSINGESYGPYRESELFARFESGRIGSETYVWTEGFKAWKLATDEARFEDALKKTAASATEPEEEPEPPKQEEQKTKRKPRDRRASRTMSLDAVQLEEQLQDERTEPEADDQSQSAEPAETSGSSPSADSNLRDTLSSDAFTDEVEDALDQMFSGGSPSDKVDKEDDKGSKKAEAAPSAAGKQKVSRAAKVEKEVSEPSKATKADQSTPEETDKSEEADTGADGDDKDSLASLKSFLAASRKERRRRTQANKAIVVPDEDDTSDVLSADEAEAESAELSTADSVSQDATATDEKPTSSVETESAVHESPKAVEPQADADDTDATQSADTSEPSVAAKSGDADDEHRDDDDEIDLSELLAGDLTGTGFGQETAAHAAIDDSKPEPDSARKSNLPLIFIIVVLILGIVFVVVELTSKDEPEPTPDDEQSAEEATIGPANEPNRGLSQAEIRDRRLSISSAEAGVIAAAAEAARAAFNAVPDEIRNPEAARRAQAAANQNRRTNRGQRQQQVVESDPPRLDDPSVAFAQPSFDRGGDSGGGPSRQAFANGLNTFVQQSVFQCQRAHMRREGELAVARVAVTIRVNPDGTVSRVSVPSQIAATTFANCLQSQARNWRFNGFAGDSVVIERTYIIQ